MIKPENTELPVLKLNQTFNITFTSENGDINIKPLFNDQNININKGNISGKYVAGNILVKTRYNFKDYQFTKFSDIPKGHFIYHFITSKTKEYNFKYEVSDGTNTKIYNQRVVTDWTDLSKEFREFKWQD